MNTYREFWHRKYGLKMSGVPVGDAEVPPSRCRAEGGPEKCSVHGPMLRKADEADILTDRRRRASRLPKDVFDDGEKHGLPSWFQDMYAEVVQYAVPGSPAAARREERAMHEFLDGKDYWLGDLTKLCKQKYGERFGHGLESDVYEDGDSVVKVLTMRLAGDPVSAMERIALHNRLFPDTMLEVEGCGWANRYGKPDGKLAFLVRQRKVEFDKYETTPEDVAKFMEELGFKRGTRKSTYVSADGSLLATDMHMENVVRTKYGGMAVLDSLMRLNTEAAGQGGEYDTANPPERLWTPKAEGHSMDETTEKTENTVKAVSGDPFEIPGTGMTSAEWHRRKRAKQYAAEGLDPRRLDWQKLHEQSMRLRAQRRRSGD